MKMKVIERGVHDGLQQTPERLAELKRLAAMPDEAVDTSDAPELTGAELAASTQLVLALTNETLAAHAERMNHEVERGFSPLPDFR
jgi:hypothetical protein